ncbi:MAG: hypothetical protein G01um101448_980 [Parcubacteria group bacterium Gr01-1014_48]|nr:MAG: hypothetical protein Greene041614_1171 [Parcubacteria group bacterium Greene0416_14]TSC72388.1 MAG: hypothetical protein G01um101448_980 [Parcubacteria group bacterium Gr01-1014_48]TSC98990.1 MAG: hypothetical protein Greene101415_1205 [Parcubacteria group bacterium Greene1014_15]TSD06920.1 MAG: hypothetical protein Greene07144_1059 [Parcubacteria group bacterium Greene0714_4]
MKDPSFCADLAMRYHSRRGRFIHRLEIWALMLAAIVPFSFPFVWKWLAVIDGKIKFPWFVVVLGVLYTAVWLYVAEKTGKEDPWTRTKFSRKHRDAKRRFGDIERKLMFAVDSNEVTMAVADLANALRENPLKLKVLTAMTYNECLVAREWSPSLLRIGWWQRIMSSWCDVGVDRIVPDQERTKRDCPSSCP